MRDMIAAQFVDLGNSERSRRMAAGGLVKRCAIKALGVLFWFPNVHNRPGSKSWAYARCAYLHVHTCICLCLKSIKLATCSNTSKMTESQTNECPRCPISRSSKAFKNYVILHEMFVLLHFQNPQYKWMRNTWQPSPTQPSNTSAVVESGHASWRCLFCLRKHII